MTSAYTEEQEKQLIELYTSGVPIEEIMAKIGKTKKSIISKLVRIGIYINQPKKTSDRITNKQYYRDIEELLGVTFITDNFQKKCDIELLIKGIKNLDRQV